MEKQGLKLNTFNLILGIVGGVVTIIASIGGSYVTTQVVLARHDERLKILETKTTKINDRIEKQNERIDKQMDILMKIDKTVAVIEERTKK